MTTAAAPFSGIYRQFTELFHRSAVQEEDEPRVPEKVIRCVWNDQMFKSHQLKTTRGHQLEVISPGYWNFGGGPDFKNAVIRVDGKTHEGDVELHVYGTEWKAHGHSNNNDYDNVILHVFLWKNRGGKNQEKPRPEDATGYSRPHIFELELKGYLREGILKLNEQLDFDSYPLLNQFNYGLCHGPLSRLSTEKLMHLLDSAGDARIQAKMDRYHDRIIINGYEQTFYEGVAEALGYPSNKQPFRDLAERVPVAGLRQRIPGAATPAQQALPLQAVLFGVSGLLEARFPAPAELDAESRAYVETLQSEWTQRRAKFQDRIMDPADWKFGRMRPTNFPYRRIAALSHLVVAHRERGIFENYVQFLRSVVSISKGKGYNEPSGKKAFRFFYLEADDYWSRHYTPGGKPLKSGQSLIGADRSREILINIGLPIGLIFARASRSMDLEKLLHQWFHTQTRPTDNQWLRFMRRYILGDEERLIECLKSDQQTQGLMQVYQDFCTKNKNNCLRCKFPGVVEKYFS